MFVYHSTTPPVLWDLGTRYPHAQVRLASVAAREGVRNSLAHAVWALARKHQLEPDEHRGFLYVRRFGWFWVQGTHAELEQVAHDREGGLFNDSDELLGYLESLNPNPNV